jgi:G3E family GTPase
VIGGFLGAGKTTLLNHWLRAAQGQRLAILVNDFGSLNIDVSLIAARSGDTIALTNGCVCCNIGDDLTAALINVIDTQPPFDGVVIEASGVSDPWRIAQVGLADPALALDGVIVLCDASVAREQAQDPLLADSLLRQLHAADVVVLNKMDLLDANNQAATRDWLHGMIGAVPVFEATDAQVPLPMLTGLAMPKPAVHSHCDHTHTGHAAYEMHGELRNEHDHTDHAAQFETWSLQQSAVFNAVALRTLLRAMPTGVLRLKGIVQTDQYAWAEMQFAGKRGALRAATALPQYAAAGVVAIGLRGKLPTALLDAAFKAATLT